MKRSLILPLLISTLFSIPITVTSTVMDSDDNPISGANIYSNHIGAISDEEGNFSIEMELTSVITFSHIGYEEINILARDITGDIHLSRSFINGKEIYGMSPDYLRKIGYKKPTKKR